MLFRLLRYFRGVPEIGALLAGQAARADPRRVLLDPAAVERHHGAVELFPRAAISTCSSPAPVDWLKLYGAKLLETAVHSSWMVVLMAMPMFDGVRRRLRGRAVSFRSSRSARSFRSSSFRR